jgi:hypothetical protein
LRIFKTKLFVRYARRERIDDVSLREAIERAERGLVDGNLGSDVIKQRVARKGQGRSGGYRVLIAYQRSNRAVFLYGFAKSERENIDDDELATLQDIAAGWLKANDAKLGRAIADGFVQEVDYEQRTKET